MFDIIYLKKFFEIIDKMMQPAKIKWREVGEKKGERTCHMLAENTYGDYYMDTREVIRDYLCYFYPKYEKFYLIVV